MDSVIELKRPQILEKMYGDHLLYEKCLSKSYHIGGDH